MTKLSPALMKMAALRALGPEARPSKVLMNKLGVSRDKLRSLVTVLMAEGLVVEGKVGNAKAWRFRTAGEVLRQAQASVPRGRVVRIVGDEKLTQRVLDALELYARLGMGQFESVTQLARFEALRRRDGAMQDIDVLDDAEAVQRELKYVLTGRSASASYGIHSASVHEDFKTAWRLYKTLAHRMAWDRNPTEPHGVLHYEPMRDDPIEATVFSEAWPNGRILILELATEAAEGASSPAAVFAAALSLCARLHGGDLSTLVELAETGLLRKAPDVRSPGMAAGQLPHAEVPRTSAQDLARARELAEQLQRMLVGPMLIGAPEQPVRSPLAAVADQVQAVLSGDDELVIENQARVSLTEEAYVPAGLVAVPAGMVLRWMPERGSFGVLHLDAKGDAPAVVAESRHIQTALLKAQAAARALAGEQAAQREQAEQRQAEPA